MRTTRDCGAGPVVAYAPALYGLVDFPTPYAVTLGAPPQTRPPPAPPPQRQPPRPAPGPAPTPPMAPPVFPPAPPPAGLPGPVAAAAPQTGYSTGTVILGVLGVAAAIALGVYAYRSWSAPSAPPTARR